MVNGSRWKFAAFRLTWSEINGALGDLGVLLPLTAALITVNGLSATSVFFGVGIAYIVTGLYYRLPLPVQPLKAVAAIAIARGLGAGAVVAAGWWMGLLLLVLAFTDLHVYIGRLFTRPVIRGIQVGVGLLLVRSGLSLASRPQITPGGPDVLLHVADCAVPVGWLLAAVVALVLGWATWKRQRWPAAIFAILLGLIAVAASGSLGSLIGQVRAGISIPKPMLPRWSDLGSSFTLLVLPQIPLTLGNAVFATADTARQYFGDGAARVTPRNLLKSMGGFQLLAALIGGVPVCHGCGGLTAHYKLGARSGLAPFLLGSACLALALFVDGNVLPLLSLIPYPVLGALLAFVGVQHGMLARDVRSWREWGIIVAVAAVGYATQNLALGFGLGISLEQAGRGLAVLRRKQHLVSER
ncbi:MAG: putative sulfate/molybdate transporter [Anaerolineae bacterium]